MQIISCMEFTTLAFVIIIFYKQIKFNWKGRCPGSPEVYKGETQITKIKRKKKKNENKEKRRRRKKLEKQSSKIQEF